MAEVLAEHPTRTGYQPSVFRTVSICDACGVVAQDHQAEQLAANGYGKLEDAWDEGEAAEYEIRLNPESNVWEAVKDNPYRSQQ